MISEFIERTGLSQWQRTVILSRDYAGHSSTDEWDRIWETRPGNPSSSLPARGSHGAN